MAEGLRVVLADDGSACMRMRVRATAGRGLELGEEVEVVARHSSAVSNSGCLGTIGGKREEEVDTVFEQSENP